MTPEAPAPPPPAGDARAAVHDLGYRRYLGSRRPQRTRWRAVVKNMLRMAWQGYWRAKTPLGIAIIVVASIGFGMAIALDTASKAISAAGGSEMVRSAATATLSRGLDTALASAFLFLPWVAFMLTLTALGRTVARDLGAGAFEFYFSRPVRALDYVIGKLAGAFLLVGAVLLIGPFILASLRVGLDWENVAHTWKLIPQSVFVGLLATMFFASVPLALSSLVAKPRNALILWAIVWVLIGLIAQAAAANTGNNKLLVFSPYSLIIGAAYGLFGMKQMAMRVVPDFWLSVFGLLGYSVASVCVLYWRVRSIERAGLGAR